VLFEKARNMIIYIIKLLVNYFLAFIHVRIEMWTVDVNHL